MAIDSFLMRNPASKVFYYKDSLLFFFTQDHLYQLNQSAKISNINLPLHYLKNALEVYCDTELNLWLTTYNDGVYKFSFNNGQYITSLLRLSMAYFRRAKPMLRQTYYRIPLSLKLRLSIRKLFNFSIGLKGVKGQQSGGSLPKGSVGQVLIIERSVPRPNQDAGAMMIHNFMKVLIELGYGVTLYPADLQYDAAYTPQLTEMGIRCLYRPLIESLEHHLAAAGHHYNYVLTCRPEYTEVVIPIIRAYCAKAHLIYETHDLHFVRERRQAEIEQDHNLLAASHKRKIQELNIAAGAAWLARSSR